MKYLRRFSLLLACMAMVFGVGGAYAQTQTGNIYGSMIDAEGSPIPGVTVTLYGAGAPRSFQSDEAGKFRFLGLYPGKYEVRAELEGLQTVVRENIDVRIGQNSQIDLQMGVAAVADTVTVTAESPLLDPRKTGAGITVTQAELESIPTSRDPWVILSQAPGVQTDRINVGGSESGQQSTYVSKGDNGDNSVWSMDGVVITDMGAIGSSPFYYDFDSFAELQVTTGGADVGLATGGAVMNLVTKRGSNEWRGSARYLLTDEKWQSKNWSEADLAPDQRQELEDDGVAGVGNQLNEIQDYGVEVGGPIVQDRAWVWGSYGMNKVDLLTLDGYPDSTELENYALKLDGQIAANNSATFFYHYGNKQKSGRSAGPDRPPETTWDQDGPGDLWKLEDTHIFSANFYLSLMGSYVSGPFELVPQSGDNPGQNAVQDVNGVWHNTFYNYNTERPQYQARLEGNNYLSTGDWDHELKYGFLWREAEVLTEAYWQGDGIFGFEYYETGYYYPGSPAQGLAVTTRPVEYTTITDYTSLYVGDSMLWGDLTINAGLRYDKQTGSWDPSVIPEARANSNPDVDLPGITWGGGDIGFDWTSVTPRLGATYAFNDGKTLVRGGYSQYADQLGTSTANWASPFYWISYQYQWYEDTNGDGDPDIDEVSGNLGTFYFDPRFPDQAVAVNVVDPDMSAPIMDEISVGLEHSLLPEFTVGAGYTYRKHDTLTQDLLVFDSQADYDAGGKGRRATQDDYVFIETVSGTMRDGTEYDYDVYDLRDGLLTNGGAYLYDAGVDQIYSGFEVFAVKRLSNNWMMRMNFNYNSWKWNTPSSAVTDPNNFRAGNTEDNMDVLVQSTGSGNKGDIWMGASRWQYNITGLYQVMPDRVWGFNLGASLYGREGYAAPYYNRRFSGMQNNFQFLRLTPETTSERYPDVHLLDLRVEWPFTIGVNTVTLSVDAFNVFNSGDTLQRELRLNTGRGDYLDEMIPPRVFRIGLRYSLR